MVLLDTGPLVALVDPTNKPLQGQVTALVQTLAPLVTTWPCLTEALYLSGQLAGWSGQVGLRDYLTRGTVSLHQPKPDEWARSFVLMEQYQDAPMDLADASLVALAEQSGTRQILTLDSDFYFYRIGGTETFEVILLPPT